MEAPEKIYVSTDPFGFLHAYDCENHPPIVEEYIRKDAFIKKACEWLKNYYRDYMYNPTGERLEAFFGGDMCNDFENYMREK